MGCRVVQLRASPRPVSPQEDGSIYRYDQAALMAAIAGRRA
jgi:two-component system chemotaxis sensor kinase CheA